MVHGLETCTDVKSGGGAESDIKILLLLEGKFKLYASESK